VILTLQYYFQFSLTNLFSVTFIILLAYRQIGRFYCFYINCFSFLHTVRLDGSIAFFTLLQFIFCILPPWLVLLLSFNALFLLFHYFHTTLPPPLPPWYQSHESYAFTPVPPWQHSHENCAFTPPPPFVYIYIYIYFQIYHRIYPTNLIVNLKMKWIENE
jgi:hypothetical protein